MSLRDAGPQLDSTEDRRSTMLERHSRLEAPGALSPKLSDKRTTRVGISQDFNTGIISVITMPHMTMNKMHNKYGYRSLLKKHKEMFFIICSYVLSDLYGSWYDTTPRGKIKQI